MATKPTSSVELLSRSPQDLSVTERQLACAILLARADKLPKDDPQLEELLRAAKRLLDFPKGTGVPVVTKSNGAHH